IYLGSDTFNATTYDLSIDDKDSIGFTSTISFAGDINNDGYDEIFTFAPNFPIPENPVGKVYIFSYVNFADVGNDKENIPNTFKLNQNYPNPFNPKTIISWQQPVRSQVKITVYDMLGSEV